MLVIRLRNVFQHQLVNLCNFQRNVLDVKPIFGRSYKKGNLIVLLEVVGRQYDVYS